MTRPATPHRRLARSFRVVQAVLRNPALRRVELAFLLFNAVEFGTWVTVLLYAYDASGPGFVGIVALAQLMPAAVFAPIAASLADRFPRDRVLFGGYLVQALAFGATAAGMLSGASPILVYTAAAAAAAGITFTRPAQGSLLPSLARTPEELTAANGLSGTVEGGGVLLGPLIAALVLGFASAGTVFVLGAVGCLVSAALVVRLPHPAVPASPAAPTSPGPEAATATPTAAVAPDAPSAELHGGLVQMVVGGLSAMSGTRDTRLVVMLLSLRMLTSGAMDVLFVLLALELFHTGDSGAGILNAGLGLGTVVGGAVTFALVGRQRLAPAIALSALTWGAAIVVVAVLAPAWLAPGLIAIGGIGFAAVDVAGRTILQRVTPDHRLARVLGALEGIGLVGLSVGSVLVPVLAAAVGVQATLAIVGLLLPVAVGVAWAGLRSIDRRVQVPVRELALLARTEVFAALPPPQLEAVARRTRWVTLEPREVLIREGDEGDRYYVLESGELVVTIGGREVNRMREPGDAVGEIALLRNVPRTATVAGGRSCVLLALDRTDFLTAVTGHDQAGHIVDRVARERLGAPEGGTGQP